MALFTQDNARLFAAKSVASRQINRAAAQQRLATIDKAAEEAARTTVIAVPPTDPDPILVRRLARVRLQLDMVDTRIEGEACKRHCDGQLLNWLCSAQERLAEQERLLAGRPLPGTLKPVVERKPSSDSRGAAIPRPPDPTTPAMPTEQIAPPIHAVKGIQGVSKGDYPPPCREQSALPDKANPTPPLPAGGPAQQPSLTERPDFE